MSPKENFLRKEKLYKDRDWVYYFALVTNLLIRFIWVGYIAKGGLHIRVRAFSKFPLLVQQCRSLTVTDRLHRLLIPVFYALEMLRRFQWNFFRVENEVRLPASFGLPNLFPLADVSSNLPRVDSNSVTLMPTGSRASCPCRTSSQGYTTETHPSPRARRKRTHHPRRDGPQLGSRPQASDCQEWYLEGVRRADEARWGRMMRRRGGTMPDPFLILSPITLHACLLT
jgi:hypothetical protein